MFAAGEEYFEMKEKNSNLRYSDSYNPKKKFYPEQVEQPGPSLIDSSFLVRHQEKIEILSRKIEEFERAKTKKFKERLDERWKLVERIQNQICSKNSKLVPIGSMVTGLATDLNSSDIDLCFVSNESKFLEDFYKYPDFRRFFMKKTADLLELMGKDDPNLEFSQPATFLPDAHTPLVEVSFKNGMSLDIAFPKNDYHSLRNTNLMKLYVAADPRFPQLYLWFRTLLQSLGIRNSKEGLLSSYHVQLLVVHFLQCYMINNPTVLPILCKTHPNLVTNDLKIDEVIERIEDFGVKIQDWKSANTMSVGELAIRLIEYYKNFPVHEDVILIESGRVIKRKQHRASTRLQILDPYSSVTVARSDLIPWAFRDGMKFIHLEMLQGRMIDSFPEFPEAREFQFDPRRALNVDENVQE
uniref:Polymerase nucleotidyl transferase domain-containing protein n=1 Tax=Acrobeloides nanus TaxID=290746 RepID=A0A914C3A9_9BILA